MATYKNQSGFGIIETLLILAIISILGFTGLYVYHVKQTSDKDYSAAATTNVPTYKTKATRTETSTKGAAATTANSYAGWKAATLKYSGISYKYPASWTLNNSSYSTAGSGSSGIDKVELTSPSNSQVTLWVGFNEADGGSLVSFGDTPIRALSQNLYLVLENTVNPYSSTPNPSEPTDACLASVAKPSSSQTALLLRVPSTMDRGSAVSYLCYYPYTEITQTRGSGTTSTSSPPAETADSIQTSGDFSTARLIFESLTH